MTTHKSEEDNSTMTCEICHHQISKSVSHTAEGKDYVWNLCGPCYHEWESQN